MKTLFLPILFLLTLKSSAQCDSVYFRNAASFIYDLMMPDTNRIVGVGDNGYVIKSSDGGKTWRNIPTFQSRFLRAVCAASDSVYYAVGYYRTIIKSEDQGETWFPLFAKTTSPFISAAEFLNDVYFLNKDKGFIVGDGALLYATIDGGRSWKETSFYTIGISRFNCITFVNDTLGFICGGNALLRTINGGFSWEKIDVDFIGINRNITKLRFLDHLTGFAVGDNGLCLKTTNGGSTWTQLSPPTGGIFYDLCIVNAQTIFIGGGGIVLKSTNGGATWNVAFSSQSSCYTVAADPAKKKIMFAGGGSQSDFLGYNGRSIVATSDLGVTFQQLSANIRIDYRDIYFLNDSTGFITGQAGHAYKTSDYGESWKLLGRIPALLAGNDPRSVFFLDEKLGYASSDRIYKTLDSGATWTQTSVPGGQAQYAAKRMFFYDSLRGLVMDNYSIYRTADGGTSWSPVLTIPTVLKDFCTTPNGKAYAVGYNGVFFTSANEGVTWTPFNLNSTDYLTSVYFYNNSTGFIGTSDTTLYKTINGGVNWTKISNKSIGVTETRSLIFVNDSTGYMIRSDLGGVGSVFSTKNGGLFWQQIKQVSEELSRLTGVKTIYTAGESGLLYKSENARVPTIPGYIYGPDLNCQNTASIFQTGDIPGTNFHWTLSGGGTQSAKQNLDTVRWTAPGSHVLSVAASNVCGTSAIRQISIPVSAGPAIAEQPQPQAVCPGTPATFSVTASGPSLTYQWRRGSVNISGATNPTLTIPATTAADSANYSVTVTSLCGSVTSLPAKLTLLAAESCTTGILTPATWIEAFVLMPNVVSSRTILKVISTKNKIILLSIVDVNGRVVQRWTRQLETGENNFELDVSKLPSGIYQLVATSARQHVQSLRFIKM